MTRSTQLTIVFLLLLLVGSACSKANQNSASGTQSAPAASPSLAEDKRIRSVDVVKATAQPAEIAAGNAGEVVVHLAIQNGYHINANPPAYPYLIATTLEIPAADGVSLGKISYPKALNRKFVFAEKPLAVYEGETEVKAQMKADKSAKQGQLSLAAKLRVQACDEAVCYPPGNLDLVIPVSIK